MPGVRECHSSIFLCRFYGPALLPNLDIWLNNKFLIAPDAIAQVKRGLRGLFSRKKKNQTQQNPTSDNSNAAAVPTAATESVPPPTKTGILKTHLNSFLL